MPEQLPTPIDTVFSVFDIKRMEALLRTYSEVSDQDVETADEDEPRLPIDEVWRFVDTYRGALTNNEGTLDYTNPHIGLFVKLIFTNYSFMEGKGGRDYCLLKASQRQAYLTRIVTCIKAQGSIKLFEKAGPEFLPPEVSPLDDIKHFTAGSASLGFYDELNEYTLFLALEVDGTRIEVAAEELGETLFIAAQNK